MLEIENFNFYAENCIVHKEKHIGKVTDKEGGRIDILLIDKDNNAIIIENKIYASDGENQHNKKFKIVYLTLNGNEASDSSFGKNKSEIQDEYICISYRNKIIQWLERCGEIANKQPLVRETIHQYITLIKQLTNQNMEDKNKQEILDLMKSHIEASFKIAESIEDIRKIVVENLAQKLKEKLDIKEEIKIRYWKNILPHIHMPYKKYWILFGCDGGGIYASIQTENEVLLLQKNSAEVLKNDLFDQYQYPFNHPFGFSRLGFSFRDDKRSINCMNENSNEFKKMEDWE